MSHDILLVGLGGEFLKEPLANSNNFELNANSFTF